MRPRRAATRSCRSAREHIAKDLAADLVRLLSRGGRGADAARPTSAVLVQTNRNAALVRDALDAAGVPAVINGAGSVFGTATADASGCGCSRRSSGRRRTCAPAPPR